MQFFVDTAEIADIRKLYDMGLLDGVTTNPSLVAKSGRDFKEVVKEICSVVPGPVSAEVASTEFDGMMAEGKVLAKLADNVVVKVPLTVDGLKATKKLGAEGIKTNVTLCFSPNQALLAAKCGATYISPFLGRLDDINLDGVELIEQIRQIYDNYNFTTQILAASIRTPNHVTQVALAGADVATIPPAVIYKLADHPLTKSGLEQFVKDWKGTGQSIL
ncbi:MAG: fructose-6-phosphate aldolase [Devosia sp.]|jgi:transaldolase|uniref:fructose-6-phosphate aldolase n=1 Tax=unclassified Devosia TaxID=196773 RepID=UPI000925CD79|nr:MULTISPECIES: fructose-6-phosphate aldolase [unclassified Devosia]MBL8596393.1 fructose-6-phosphate aldolase [Devosia sp.]MBN9345259.1 fructose-6-phosphate aldolase [Devosia sp.]OJX49050.1 MAG: fructose-6-phosphate aldolase [Devosia sp. 66-22]